MQVSIPRPRWSLKYFRTNLNTLSRSYLTNRLLKLVVSLPVDLANIDQQSGHVKDLRSL